MRGMWSKRKSNSGNFHHHWHSSILYSPRRTAQLYRRNVITSIDYHRKPTNYAGNLSLITQTDYREFYEKIFHSSFRCRLLKRLFQPGYYTVICFSGLHRVCILFNFLLSVITGFHVRLLPTISHYYVSTESLYYQISNVLMRNFDWKISCIALLVSCRCVSWVKDIDLYHLKRTSFMATYYFCLEYWSSIKGE